MLAGLNSFAHFWALLLASLFSHRAAWRIYRHWGRIALRIFGITLSLRDDNAGHLGASGKRRPSAASSARQRDSQPAKPVA